MSKLRRELIDHAMMIHVRTAQNSCPRLLDDITNVVMVTISRSDLIVHHVPKQCSQLFGELFEFKLRRKRCGPFSLSERQLLSTFQIFVCHRPVTGALLAER
jgi:hypothetical protein